MTVWYTLLIALKNLSHSKLRTLLAMLGILVGTASVVAMVSSGQLATQQALSQFKTLGTNLLAVSMFQTSRNPGGGVQRQVTLQDTQELFAQQDNLIALAPYSTLFANLSYGGNKINGGIIGSTATLAQILKLDLQAGRFLSYLDSFEHFCIIGQQIYQQIRQVSAEDPIGKQLLLGKNFYTIIGILNTWPQNSFFNQNVNTSVFIPIRTSKTISTHAQINNLIMLLLEGSAIDSVESNIRQFFAERTPNEKLFFRSAKQLIRTLEGQQHILTIFLGLIGSISLIVGGIGVMNIMLVSVVERRKEIGIRRAIGARKRDIQTMFLIEAIILSVIGGISGVLVGISISFFIALYANWAFTLFILPPIIGFWVSVLIGVFFGFYPAYQASQLNPIETLHSE